MPLMDGAGAVGAATKYAREDHQHPADTSRAPIASPVFTGDPQAPTPSAADNDTSIATTAFVKTAAAAFFRGYIDGLVLSTAGASASVSVAAGIATDSTSVDIMTVLAAITKTTGAWAVGTGNGGLDTGAIAASTWYHVHLIKRPDTSVVDALISLSAVAPTLPANYTRFRRIGSIKTNASLQWVKFIQNGESFVWDVPVNDVAIGNGPGATAVSWTLSVPTGVKVLANFAAVISGGNTSTDYPGGVFFSDLAIADSAAATSTLNSLSLYSGYTGQIAIGAMVQVMTNTSAQIRSRLEHSTSGTSLYIITHGWLDPRGRNS